MVQLNNDEQIVGIVRRSVVVELPRLSFAALWVLVPFFFFFPLLQLGFFGLGFFLVLLAWGIYYALRKWLKWNYTMLIITDQRIIDVEQRGIVKREITEMPIDDISEVKGKRRGMFGKIFNIGDIRVETIKAQKFDLELSGVRRPEEVSNLIIDVQYMTGDASPTKSFHTKKVIKTKSDGQID
ncbi:MAG: PH domain-containing protein [Patescibacteria group bacterium]